MADILLRCYRESLPAGLTQLLQVHIASLEEGRYYDLLTLPLTKLLLGHENVSADARESLDAGTLWSDVLFTRLGTLLSDRSGEQKDGVESSQYKQHTLSLVAFASLQAFLQSNVTGPPLPFNSAEVIFPSHISKDSKALKDIRASLIVSLGADGAAAYKLTPNVELLCLAETILTVPVIKKNIPLSGWLRLRIDFVHQRCLGEVASSLQTAIYDEIQSVSQMIEADKSKVDDEVWPGFLLETAAIHTHHGFDKKAREAVDQASRYRHFEFALTGLLGKRTKFQQQDISQLIVLAKSAGSDQEIGTIGNPKETASKPQNLDLNDDTLLESISFQEKPDTTSDAQEHERLPKSLSSLDANDQPLLEPLDSIALLSYASSITNTSPADGLTREETLPYAVRVLDGGSSNWQVYTQALLVRSRIEGYKSRTIERGLLQLQALVDQVIAETAPPVDGFKETSSTETQSSTFLPRASESTAAPVQDRLRFVYQLNSPTRWEMEAELASRWVSLGGLRSALEIYERLEMWPEAALCWAATDKEEKAKAIVRRQLRHATGGDDESVDPDTEKWEGKERMPPPADAPRLYCILGDIDKDPTMYEKAWIVSDCRYARAQRSLGRFYIAARDYVKAAGAYSKALKTNQLNHGSWFALGCALLELSEFERAAEAFSRTVQLDESDAEAWSNLATAYLHKGPSTESARGVEARSPETLLPDEAVDSAPRVRQDGQQYKRDALKALKKAASLKYDNFRIWDNLLTVAASTVPPSYGDVVIAQKRLIEMRGSTDGEKCVDATILEYLVRHVISASAEETGISVYDSSKPGLPRMVVEMVDKQVVPLITSSVKLWQIVGQLALWRKRPSTALEANEKAWRAGTSQPAWEAGTEQQWDDVVQATVELVDAYESLGPVERTEGLAAGSGELVAKDWKFKARSAIRGVMGKGKTAWEGSAGWEKLQSSLDSLKAS